MAINVSQAFHRTSANPVDESIALTKAQMLTVNDNLMPAYYFTICQDDGKIYLYDKSATASATTGKFKEFEGGGGGGGTGGLTIDATLTAAGWNNSTKQQTLTFTGYESSMGGVIGMPIAATAAQKTAYAEAKINVVSQSGTSFTFECEEIPAIDLPVTLYAGGSGGGGSADLPSGGTTGQVLVKKSNTDGDVEWKDVGNSVFEIHFANDAVDVTYSQLGEAFSANKILKLIDTENNVVLAFTGYYSGAYYFSTICLNRRQEMVNTSITLYQSAPSSDVIATQVQRLTLTEDVQKIEMPTADSSYLNKIYQYIGTTDANFTNGLFYRCVNTSGTYTWQECETQHRLTPGELADIMSTLPGAPTQYPKYSTTEQVVGEWLDGKPIYQKTINFGALPNNTTKNVAHEISNLDYVVEMYGVSSDGSIQACLPYVNPASLSNAVSIKINGSNIQIVTASNMSTFTKTYITIQYTKTTD